MCIGKHATMKTIITLSLALILTTSAYAQFGISYHQSNLSFAGVNYQLGDRFNPEFRLAVNTLLSDLSPELVVNYQFIKKPQYQVYAGIGGRLQIDAGAVVPFGVNIYPFDNQQFGFHTELAAILSEDNEILRGSWGIRYRFN